MTSSMLRPDYVAVTILKQIVRNPLIAVRRHEPVTKSANGLDATPMQAQFVAQSAHMGVNGTCIDHDVIPPDIAEKTVPGLHSTLPLHQNSQQLKLGRCAVDHTISDLNLMTRTVEHELSRTKQLRFIILRPAPENRANPQHELARTKRLDHVIICSEFKSEHPIDLLGFGRKHDDRYLVCPGIRFDHPAEIQTGNLRQHQV